MGHALVTIAEVLEEGIRPLRDDLRRQLIVVVCASRNLQRGSLAHGRGGVEVSVDGVQLVGVVPIGRGVGERPVGAL